MSVLDVSPWEVAARMFEPPPPRVRRWASPLDMAAEIHPKIVTNPDMAFVRTPALDCINAGLARLADAPSQRKLAVFMPPQEGKSSSCSYWNVLWLLADNPDLRVMVVSYNAEKAREWGADVKTAVEFFDGMDGRPNLGIRLRDDSRAAGRWKIEGSQGGLYCAGVESGISGRPADYIIVDDPLKNLQDAQSIAKRGNVTATYRGAIVPRMGPRTKMVWVQTLWHESETILETLAIEGDSWEVIRIPAICDSPDDPLGRQIGEPMRSARGDRDWNKIRRDVGAYVFAALYNQRPSPAEGGLFKRLWWRRWVPAPQGNFTSPRLDLGGRVILLGDTWRFATMDLAASTRTSADYTVAAAWARTMDGDLILLDYIRAKVGEAEHFSLVRPMVQRWQLDTVFVEASQHETTLVKDATREGVPISPIQAEVDKFSRALPYSARVSNGRVWLPANHMGVDAWIGEHASFPAGSHDDMVDTGSMATRVSATQWSPVVPVPRPSAKIAEPEVDFLTVEL